MASLVLMCANVWQDFFYFHTVSTTIMEHDAVHNTFLDVSEHHIFSGSIPNTIIPELSNLTQQIFFTIANHCLLSHTSWPVVVDTFVLLM